MTTEPRQTTEPAAKTQSSDQFITRRLRLAGVLIIAGILVQGLTLVWNHPLSFLAFLGIGIPGHRRHSVEAADGSRSAGLDCDYHRIFAS